jgi:hypothetical protein
MLLRPEYLSQELDRPHGILRTIRDACNYMTGMGKKRKLRDHWQRVCKLIQRPHRDPTGAASTFTMRPTAGVGASFSGANRSSTSKLHQTKWAPNASPIATLRSGIINSDRGRDAHY